MVAKKPAAKVENVVKKKPAAKEATASPEHGFRKVGKAIGKGRNFRIITISKAKREKCFQDHKPMVLSCGGANAVPIRIWRRACEKISCMSIWENGKWVSAVMVTDHALEQEGFDNTRVNVGSVGLQIMYNVYEHVAANWQGSWPVKAQLITIRNEIVRAFAQNGPRDID